MKPTYGPSSPPWRCASPRLAPLAALAHDPTRVRQRFLAISVAVVGMTAIGYGSPRCAPGSPKCRKAPNKRGPTWRVGGSGRGRSAEGCRASRLGPTLRRPISDPVTGGAAEDRRRGANRAFAPSSGGSRHRCAHRRPAPWRAQGGDDRVERSPFTRSWLSYKRAVGLPVLDSQLATLAVARY